MEAQNCINTQEQNYAGTYQVPQPQHVCPACGYCPCCGRRRYDFQPYPYAPYNPWGPIWTSSGTMNTLNDGHTVSVLN